MTPPVAGLSRFHFERRLKSRQQKPITTEWNTNNSSRQNSKQPGKAKLSLEEATISYFFLELNNNRRDGK